MIGIVAAGADPLVAADDLYATQDLAIARGVGAPARASQRNLDHLLGAGLGHDDRPAHAIPRDPRHRMTMTETIAFGIRGRTDRRVTQGFLFRIYPLD